MNDYERCADAAERLALNVEAIGQVGDEDIDTKPERATELLYEIATLAEERA